MSPLVGILIDKFGVRKLLIFGWSVAGLGFFLASRINSLWAFYGTFVLIALGMSFGTFVPVTTAIANWFVKKRSRAMTIGFVGYGASGVLVPLLQAGISNLGWRETLAIIGVVSLVVGSPLSLVIRHKPADYGLFPDGDERSAPAVLSEDSNSPGEKVKRESTAGGFTLKAAFRTPVFWILSGVVLVESTGYAAVSAHTVPFLESVNISAALAAMVVTGSTLCSLLGRLGFGFLGDFVDKRYLLAAALALQTIGTFIFAYVGANTVWLIIPFIFTYGPGFGGFMPLRPAIQADFFGTRAFGAIMGIMSVAGIVSGMVSPVFAGWVFDTSRSYHLAWLLLALITIPGIPLVLLARPPAGPKRAVAVKRTIG
ncbi:MAG: MFS transporter [Chloroflexota bacterium]